MSKYNAQSQRADDAVWAIISHLEPGRIEAPDAAWHWGFAQLRDEFGGKLPGLQRLEFHRSDDVAPVSDELDEILQLMSASTLNPHLTVVELTEKHQKDHLRHVDMSKFDEGAVREAAKRLRDYLKPKAFNKAGPAAVKPT
jgi:hypothetical protein